MTKSKLAVIAVGGNALIRDPLKNTLADQYEAARMSAHAATRLIQSGVRVVLTHGNGPQVGFSLRRSELAAKEVHPLPMDYAIAETQGTIGYLFQRAFQEAFKTAGIERKVASVVTQTLVDASDDAFQNPSKPIGGFLSRDEAEAMAKTMGWSVMEDSGRGWRRCVPSPKPKGIVELEVIRSLSEEGALVIACGGGGIPVVQKGDSLQGVEGVIDKDLTSALLSSELKADYLVIPTAGGDGVALHFGTPQEKRLQALSYKDAKHYVDTGYFAKGSMLEKVMAAVQYTKAHPDGTAIITTLDSMLEAIDGKAGTQIGQHIVQTMEK